MAWNWQQEDWPQFSYKKAGLSKREKDFLKQAKLILKAYQRIGKEDKNYLKVDLISNEALQTSAIEGEILNRDSLQSSIRRNFGLDDDNRRIPPAEQGIAEMMVDLYKTFAKPLSHQSLHKWHKMLMKGRTDILVGQYRDDNEPMQVVSGPVYARKVHFEAPPSKQVKKEMSAFIKWFNQTAPEGKTPLPALTRAAIAHIYFECIHPFGDGNGRIGRAIATKALSQALKQPTLIALSHTIQKRKKAYYSALELNNKHMEITRWLSYFAATILEAQTYTHDLIIFLMEKTRLYDKLRGNLNERQDKVIARMFREGLEGFEGGLSAENYIRITDASRATTTRDLEELVSKGALKRKGKLKGTRYFLNLRPWK